MTWKNGEFHPTQERAKEKKASLVRAALALFDGKGYHATNAKQIAAGAGVATGTFYRYFKDKKAVFLAIQAEMEEQTLGRINGMAESLAAGGADPALVIKTIVRQSIAMHEQHRGFHREALALEMIDPEIRAWNLDRGQRVRDRFRDLMGSMSGGMRVDDLDAALEMIYLAVEA
ncbi:MAG: TetR/AcrR family transcriptional regulator, partial [Rhodospirillales bacterium]|nr:TetR/AcrR family transcriptional regulator [Rhodospirillales bacterium]